MEMVGGRQDSDAKFEQALAESSKGKKGNFGNDNSVGDC